MVPMWGFYLIFGERLTFPQGSTFLKEIQGQNQGWAVISRDVGTLDLTHCFKIALNYLQIMGCTFY